MKLSLFKKSKTYTVLSCVTACLYLFLFVHLLFFPYRFLDDLGMAKGEPAVFILRRAAMLMLGFSVVSFVGRKAPNSAARQGIVLSISISMAGLAATGLSEYWRGLAKAAILNAATVEIIVATAYFLLWLACRKEQEEPSRTTTQERTRVGLGA